MTRRVLLTAAAGTLGLGLAFLTVALTEDASWIGDTGPATAGVTVALLLTFAAGALAPTLIGSRR